MCLSVAVLLVRPLTDVATSESGTVEQLFKLTAEDAASYDAFGWSVAINGNVAIVGAYQDDDDGTSSGSAYLFDVTTSKQIMKLTAMDATVDNLFGFSVGISENIAIVGAFREDNNGRDSGAAYLFDISTGRQLFKLKANDAAAEDYFGISVATDGNIAIVGAVRDDDDGDNSGSAYLFDVRTGEQLFKLKAPGAKKNDFFGVSVGVSGGRAIVGSHLDDVVYSNTGTAYIFDVDSGEMLFELVASDAKTGAEFGHSVAISGNQAIVGAWTDDGNIGSAYIYDVYSGEELRRITAPDGAVGDLFGVSVGICEGMVVIGADHDDDAGSASGSAYLFDLATDRYLNKLRSEDAAQEDRFGNSVGISGGVAIVGVPYDDDGGSTSGSAYLFRDVQAQFDVDPASCPNPLSLNKQGVIPAALLGAEDFDVHEVDVSTLLLEGIPPVGSRFDLVSAPFDGKMCECSLSGVDEFEDLVVEFEAPTILKALGLVAPGDELMLTLTWKMLDGTPFDARDCVIIGPSEYVFRLTVERNPVSSVGEIKYMLPEAALISLRIYDAAGRAVEDLVGGIQRRGEHRLDAGATHSWSRAQAPRGSVTARVAGVASSIARLRR
jgi:outer membrane protein assembly factor BamB